MRLPSSIRHNPDQHGRAAFAGGRCWIAFEAIEDLAQRCADLALEQVAEKSSWCEAVGIKQYSADFRDRLLLALGAGLARAEASRTFGVPERTIRRWQQRRETGSVVPQRRLGRRRHIGATAEPALRAQVAAHPDATLAEHYATWEAVHGVRLGLATMSRALARLG